jgi:hypothetical protein
LGRREQQIERLPPALGRRKGRHDNGNGLSGYGGRFARSGASATAATAAWRRHGLFTRAARLSDCSQANLTGSSFLSQSLGGVPLAMVQVEKGDQTLRVMVHHEHSEQYY